MGAASTTSLRRDSPAGHAFRRALLTAYGDELQVPTLFDGSFSQAFLAAQRSLKLLVVYLHNGSAPHSASFCINVLASDLVRTLLNGSYVFWGGDMDKRESRTVAQAVNAHEFPHLCVVLPASEDDVQVLGAVTGAAQADDAVALLTACLEDMEVHRSEMLARAEQHVEDRFLREEQDREYQEALEVDRQRDAERKRLEQEREEARRLEEEILLEERAAAERIEAEKRALEEARRGRAAVIGAEHPEAVSCIALRLPAGQRIQRKFLPDATLEDVYNWAEVAAYLPENADKSLEIPARFILKTSFPSQELTQKTRSIADLRLAGTNILLAELDDDE